MKGVSVSSADEGVRGSRGVDVVVVPSLRYTARHNTKSRISADGCRIWNGEEN